jgi:hypothetical protein
VKQDRPNWKIRDGTNQEMIIDQLNSSDSYPALLVSGDLEEAYSNQFTITVVCLEEKEGEE